MATAVLDLRRTDARMATLAHPIWTTSAAITKAADDKASILFSFPATPMIDGGRVIVHGICVQIVTAFAGGTVVLNVGTHTLATDAVTTGGSASVVDVDDYVPTASLTLGTAGYYFPAAGDWVTAEAAGTFVAPKLIVPADSTVPCISAELSSDDTITAGEARVHVLLSYVP